MAPIEVPGATIAKLNDTCGNPIQINQPARGMILFTWII
jgi:hypothetical protein